MKAKPLPKSRAKTAYGLLGEIRRIILAEPKRYDQRGVLVLVQTKFIEGDVGFFPACGTVGCVAGWVTALKPSRYEGTYAIDNATDVLGLDPYQEGELIQSDAAKGRPQTAAHARSGAAHITWFMKKYEKQLREKRV